MSETDVELPEGYTLEGHDPAADAPEGGPGECTGEDDEEVEVEGYDDFEGWTPDDEAAEA
jgi:hypothetical protein